MTTHSEKIEVAEATGIRVTAQVVREWWKCRFQEFDHRNDDGIDGLIILKKNYIVTGELVHCQIKSGSGYKSKTNYPEHIGIKLGIKYIQKHRPRWNNIIEPAILIFVDESKNNKITPNAWWVDLKSPAAYSDKAKSILFIPKKQRFAEHSIGEIKKLYGTRHLDLNDGLQEILLTRNDVNLFNLKDNIKVQARKYYIDWSTSPISEKTNPKLGEITISRVGWKHLTRSGRKTERVLQSLLLLGAAKRMIKEIKEPESFGHPLFKAENDIGRFQDYIGLRAFVSFPHRYESVLTIVMKRQRKVNLKNGKELERKIWFYTIYESRRGRMKNELRNKKKKATDS